jgi:DNA repair protein RecO (recombination protein O)
VEWTDDGIVLGARRQGETSVILELMTREHGRHSGLVRGGRSRRLQPVLQAGNTVRAVWRARLDEQLGNFTIEADTLRAPRYLGSAMALYGLAALAGHLRLLPDRDPHPILFEIASVLADHLDDPGIAPALFVRFELMLLGELGFGLDLARCAVSDVTHDLVYVSPKSGRAVSRGSGEAYHARLLELPAFLRPGANDGQPGPGDIAAGFRMTGHFFATHLYAPRGLPLPEERGRFVAQVSATGQAAPAGVSDMFSGHDETAADSARDGKA